jgi:hypothetical protein
MRALGAFALLAVGCSAPSGDAGDDPAAGSTFLAFPTTFQNYKSWEKFPVASPVDNDVHTSGPRTTYLNKRPPSQSREFPVGTVIVKELEVGAEADRKVFAMVKRGGDYNRDGARGWEWFELRNAGGGTVEVAWRGLGPPAGEMYGGDPNGGCNACHGGHRDNDFVQDPALSLSNF